MVLPSIILISLMAILARQSGGGLGANNLDRIHATWLPEAVFALVIGYAAFQSWWAIPAGFISYLAFQAGHGTVYNMQGWQSSNPDRKQTIEYLIRPVFNLFGWSIYTPRYSWACMGIKGFLIGLPLFPFGLLLAFLWPLAYAIKDSELGEWLSGAFSGLCIVLLLFT